MTKRWGSLFCIFVTLTSGVSASPRQEPPARIQKAQTAESARQDYVHSIRHMAQKNQAILLSEACFMQKRRPRYTPAQIADVTRESGWILEAQFNDPSSFFNGAINNVDGDPTWIVPRENALAILALIKASQVLKDPSYLAQANLAADFLVRAQDSDGGWHDQLDWRNGSVNPETDPSKSPTQTAEVMIALDALGFSSARYDAMKKGAEWLISMQDPNDGLLVGGIDDNNVRHTWKWASDNSFAYLALKDAATWARKAGDRKLAKKYNAAADQILQGINTVLYSNDDPTAPDYGVWHRVVDFNGVPQQTTYLEWINYAPQMLDLPALGVGDPRVGEWIHDNLQLESGAVVWANPGSPNADRQSPGFSFQASLVWLDLGQTEYANAAINWAYNSGLLQTTPDSNGLTGGWVDWLDENPATSDVRAAEWERFIDTSFYATAVTLRGYDFSD